MYYFTSCCCVCFRKRCKLIQLNSSGDNVRLLKKLEKFTLETKWTDNDVMISICDSCQKRLVFSYDFMRTCIASQKRVQGFLRYMKAGPSGERAALEPLHLYDGGDVNRGHVNCGVGNADSTSKQLNASDCNVDSTAKQLNVTDYRRKQVNANDVMKQLYVGNVDPASKQLTVHDSSVDSTIKLLTVNDSHMDCTSEQLKIDVSNMHRMLKQPKTSHSQVETILKQMNVAGRSKVDFNSKQLNINDNKVDSILKHNKVDLLRKQVKGEVITSKQLKINNDQADFTSKQLIDNNKSVDFESKQMNLTSQQLNKVDFTVKQLHTDNRKLDLTSKQVNVHTSTSKQMNIGGFNKMDLASKQLNTTGKFAQKQPNIGNNNMDFKSQQLSNTDSNKVNFTSELNIGNSSKNTSNQIDFGDNHQEIQELSKANTENKKSCNKPKDSAVSNFPKRDHRRSLSPCKSTDLIGYGLRYHRKEKMLKSCSAPNYKCNGIFWSSSKLHSRNKRKPIFDRKNSRVLWKNGDQSTESSPESSPRKSQPLKRSRSDSNEEHWAGKRSSFVQISDQLKICILKPEKETESKLKVTELQEKIKNKIQAENDKKQLDASKEKDENNTSKDHPTTYKNFNQRPVGVTIQKEQVDKQKEAVKSAEESKNTVSDMEKSIPAIKLLRPETKKPISAPSALDSTLPKYLRRDLTKSKSEIHDKEDKFSYKIVQEKRGDDKLCQNKEDGVSMTKTPTFFSSSETNKEGNCTTSVCQANIEKSSPGPVSRQPGGQIFTENPPSNQDPHSPRWLLNCGTEATKTTQSRQLENTTTLFQVETKTTQNQTKYRKILCKVPQLNPVLGYNFPSIPPVAPKPIDVTIPNPITLQPITTTNYGTIANINSTIVSPITNISIMGNTGVQFQDPMRGHLQSIQDNSLNQIVTTASYGSIPNMNTVVMPPMTNINVLGNPGITFQDPTGVNTQCFQDKFPNQMAVSAPSYGIGANINSAGFPLSNVGFLANPGVHFQDPIRGTLQSNQVAVSSATYGNVSNVESVGPAMANINVLGNCGVHYFAPAEGNLQSMSGNPSKPVAIRTLNYGDVANVNNAGPSITNMNFLGGPGAHFQAATEGSLHSIPDISSNQVTVRTTNYGDVTNVNNLGPQMTNISNVPNLIHKGPSVSNINKVESSGLQFQASTGRNIKSISIKPSNQVSVGGVQCSEAGLQLNKSETSKQAPQSSADKTSQHYQVSSSSSQPQEGGKKITVNIQCIAFNKFKVRVQNEQGVSVKTVNDASPKVPIERKPHHKNVPELSSKTSANMRAYKKILPKPSTKIRRNKLKKPQVNLKRKTLRETKRSIFRKIISKPQTVTPAPQASSSSQINQQEETLQNQTEGENVMAREESCAQVSESPTLDPLNPNQDSNSGMINQPGLIPLQQDLIPGFLLYKVPIGNDSYALYAVPQDCNQNPINPVMPSTSVVDQINPPASNESDFIPVKTEADTVEIKEEEESDFPKEPNDCIEPMKVEVFENPVLVDDDVKTELLNESLHLIDEMSVEESFVEAKEEELEEEIEDEPIASSTPDAVVKVEEEMQTVDVDTRINLDHDVTRFNKANLRPKEVSNGYGIPYVCIFNERSKEGGKDQVESDRKLRATTRGFPPEEKSHQLTTTESGTSLNSQCALCTAELSTPSALHQHYQSVHKRKTLTCAICNAIFTNKITIQRHYFSVHALSHQCPSCPQHFRSASILKRHQNVHSANVNRVCSTCGLSFISTQRLRKHIPTHMRKSSPYRCPKCDNGFDTHVDFICHQAMFCKGK